MSAIRVLFADDDYLNRKVFQIKLSRRGYRCDVAEDGKGAVEMARKERYNAVVLDQLMPGLTGAEAAREIRSFSAKTVLIAITGDPSEVPRLLAAGFDRVFLKPLRDRACIEYIESSTQAVL